MMPLLTPWERTTLAIRLLFGGLTATRLTPDRWADGTVVHRFELFVLSR